MLVLAGGGAASRLWCQTIADVTGVPTARAIGEQIGAKGAMVAATRADTEPSVERGGIGSAGLSLFEPNSSLRALFDDRHQDFLATRERLSGRWAAWAGEAQV